MHQLFLFTKPSSVSTASIGRIDRLRNSFVFKKNKNDVASRDSNPGAGTGRNRNRNRNRGANYQTETGETDKGFKRGGRTNKPKTKKRRVSVLA